MHQKIFKRAYYRIRTELFWGMNLCILFLLIAGIHANYRLWRQEQPNPSDEEQQIRIEMTYDDWRSELTDSTQCLLCKESTLHEADDKPDCETMGLILLNHWTVLDFQLRSSEAVESEQEYNSDSGIRYGYNGGITWLSSGEPSRGMAKISLTLPEHCQTDEEYIRQNLCQPCLDKVTASLRFWKGEYEEKEAVPLCLLDFQTFEIHPVQDWYRGYFIRDYWVELDFEEADLSIKTYYLPLIACKSSCSFI